MASACHTTEWQLARAEHATRVFYRRYPDARRSMPVEHYLYPAWERVRRVVPKLPADERGAARLACIAGFRGCLDEFRNVLGGRSKWRPTVYSIDGELDGDAVPETCYGYEQRPDWLTRLVDLWGETRGLRVGLPVRSRVWLYLCCVEGWSQAELAEVWGVSEQAVWHVMSAARRKVMRG